MDSLHRNPQPQETRTGRDCPFCKEFDPGFRKRDPMDRLVREQNDSSASHVSVDGEIMHRLLEIRMREGPVGYAA
jgi:hypothetical protein